VDEWAPNPDPKLPVGQRELGFNPVILAALNDHTSVLQLLGDNGVCVDAADNAKKTALMHAAGNGYVGAMRVLMAMGSRVDHQDGDGETALYRAVLNGYEPAVRILLQAQRSTSSAPPTRSIRPRLWTRRPATTTPTSCCRSFAPRRMSLVHMPSPKPR